MEATLMQAIVDGNPAITLNVNAADLKNAVLAMFNAATRQAKEEAARMREKATLTRKEVAEVLNVTENTLIRWDRDGILVAVRIGRKCLYRPSDVEAIQTQRDN